MHQRSYKGASVSDVLILQVDRGRGDELELYGREAKVLCNCVHALFFRRAIAIAVYFVLDLNLRVWKKDWRVWWFIKHKLSPSLHQPVAILHARTACDLFPSEGPHGEVTA